MDTGTCPPPSTCQKVDAQVPLRVVSPVKKVHVILIPRRREKNPVVPKVIWILRYTQNDKREKGILFHEPLIATALPLSRSGRETRCDNHRHHRPVRRETTL